MDFEKIMWISDLLEISVLNGCLSVLKKKKIYGFVLLDVGLCSCYSCLIHILRSQFIWFLVFNSVFNFFYLVKINKLIF